MKIVMQSLTYFKASNVYTNEYEGMRYRIYTEKTESETTVLKVAVWPCPWNFYKTSESEKTYGEFELSESGIEKAGQWVCSQYKDNIDWWQEHNKETLFF